MSYNKNSKQSTLKYIKDKQQRLFVNYKKDEYEQIIKPAIDKSGLPVATYIKQAIYEKIERDKEMEKYNVTKIVCSLFAIPTDKVKNKETAKLFIKNIKNDMYFMTDGKEDYCIGLCENKPILLSRPVFARGDVFNPYSEVVEDGKTREDIVVDFVYKNRKMINQKYFSKEND